ncbi:unnamed protein product [Ranitomeya imitator]|uniref:Protein PIGBOS1 n=1 Tax=Ranitomeya imitator TaxID=111125 RepID=A0ABN9L911_9NEOB|nr:unnamed protein product [Ranitomeya imitator]
MQPAGYRSFSLGSEINISTLRMKRGLPFGQIVLAVLLGFTGGVYIYKPLIQQHMYERKSPESDITTTDAVKKENE